MRSWKSWLIAGGIVFGIFYLSSIPGLRVLPILGHLFEFLMRFDVYFVRAAEFIAQRLPIDTSELGPFQKASQAFYAYAKANPYIIEFLLRKTAHAVVFYSLTLALFFVLNRYFRTIVHAVLSASILATAAAVLDEFRQSFTEGRVSSLIDVSINMIGIAIATLSLLFFMYIMEKRTPPEI